MTAVIALIGKTSVWMMTDRRMTFRRGHDAVSFIDDACKTVRVEATDGVALLGYAGLATSRKGTEPSVWMNDLLVDLHGLKTERYIDNIAHAMKVELPAHLSPSHGISSHYMFAAAIVGGQPRLYLAQTELTGPTMTPEHFYTRYSPTPPGGLAGSGAHYLQKSKGWRREAHRVLNAFERGRTSARAVADRLARACVEVADKDQTVSKGCIVSWALAGGGGGAQFYADGKRSHSDKPIPTVGNGMDINDIVSITTKYSRLNFDEMRDGMEPKNYGAEIQADLNELAKKPKRRL